MQPRLAAYDIAQKQQAIRAQQIQQPTLESEERARALLNQATEVMAQLVAYVKNFDVKDFRYCKYCERSGVTIGEAAKAAANITKLFNDLGRYIHFDRGGADSRTEVKGLDELLKHLTSDQFDQVWKWMEEGEKRAELGPS